MSQLRVCLDRLTHSFMHLTSQFALSRRPYPYRERPGVPIYPPLRLPTPSPDVSLCCDDDDDGDGDIVINARKGSMDPDQ